MSFKSFQLAEAARKPAVLVWALLVVLTGCAFWLGVDHALGTTPAALSIVLIIAIIKAWFVERYFMDLRHAPRWLRSLVDSWLAMTAALVIGMQILL